MKVILKHLVFFIRKQISLVLSLTHSKEESVLMLAWELYSFIQ